MTTDDAELSAALQTVFRRSQTDKAFRAMCLADPVRAIELATGLKLNGRTIRFVESDEDRAAAAPARPADRSS